jgi:nitrite reductase (NADH) small subunit
VKVAEESQIPIGSTKKAAVDGTEILIANVNGDYYAISNKCSHMGTPFRKAFYRAIS